MTGKKSWDLEESVKKMLQFREERDWKQFHTPRDLASAISIEASELQELFLWKGVEDQDDITGSDERFERVREEVADIAMFLLYFVNDLNIDLSDAIVNKLSKNVKRYPVSEYRGRYSKPEN